mgnify:CR=1 FL=1
MTKLKTGDVIYLADRGEIVKHNILLVDGDGGVFIDRLDVTHTTILALNPDELGIRYFLSFKEAKQNRIERVEKLVDQFLEEKENLLNQTKAEQGILKPIKND